MATTVLSKTFGTATNRKKWTMSVWLKKADPLDEGAIFSSYSTGTTSNYSAFRDNGSATYDFVENDGSYTINLRPSLQLRDPTAWYHLVLAYDSTQSVAADRVNYYVNGVLQTAWGTETYPTLNQESGINQAALHTIGKNTATDNAYFNGVMAHFHFIDGLQYAASTFGSTDATSGIWVPNTGPSVTYGNNGFFLKFQDTAAFGDDSSGNTNDFALSGTMTQTKDNPQNNFATLNPLNDDNLSVDTTFAYADLQVTKSDKGGPTATMGVTKGKWYWEIKAITLGADIQTGIYDPMYTTGKNYVEAHVGASNHGYGLIHSNGNKIHDGSNSSYGSGISADDIIMHALDMDNKKWWAGVNGTWFASGDPAAGTNEAYSTLFSAYTSTHHFITPCIGTNSASETGVYQFNFGNGYFGTTNVTSAVADGDGEGRFEYTPPTGFYALCTNNLATYG